MDLLAVKLLFYAFRPYSMPYVAFLSASGLIIAKASIYTSFQLISAGLLCWIGGMLYYDVTHQKEDMQKRPGRLLVLYPSLRPYVIIMMLVCFVFGLLLAFLVEPFVALVITTVGLAAVPFYNKFRASLNPQLKYLVRSLGGALYVVYPPLLLHQASFELFPIAFGAAFLDAGGNILGDFRDKTIDDKSSPIFLLGEKKMVRAMWVVSFIAVALLSVAPAVYHASYIYILPVIFVGITLVLPELFKKTVPTHKKYLLFKILIVL